MGFLGLGNIRVVLYFRTKKICREGVIRVSSQHGILYAIATYEGFPHLLVRSELQLCGSRSVLSKSQKHAIPTNSKRKPARKRPEVTDGLIHKAPTTTKSREIEHRPL